MFKSLFLLFLVTVVLSQSNLVALDQGCPQQWIADANNICIRPTYIEGCTIYKDTKECKECSKYYNLDNGKCSIIDESSLNPEQLVGCLKATDTQCLNCANGFRRVSGKCEKGIKECAEYNSQGVCLSCNQEYSLLQGLCRHNLLLGCKNELSDHRCSECFSPFEVHSYNCIIKNCKRYNDYGCYSCECGYYITENRSCKKFEDGCLKYYRSMCTECLPHYKLKGGVCSIEGCIEHKNNQCSACEENYELTEEGICRFKNCFDWADGRCLICNSGYNLLEGRCVKAEKKFVCNE